MKKQILLGFLFLAIGFCTYAQIKKDSTQLYDRSVVFGNIYEGEAVIVFRYQDTLCVSETKYIKPDDILLDSTVYEYVNRKLTTARLIIPHNGDYRNYSKTSYFPDSEKPHAVKQEMWDTILNQ